MKKEYLTISPNQTKKLGRKIAQEVLKNSVNKQAIIIALKGELGSGKTIFLQGFAKELNVKEKILSPTFVILKRFRIKDARKKFNNFYHIDCYRIQDAKELVDLGFKEIIKDPRNIVAVEWADRIKKIIPKHSFWIEFDFIDKNKRRILVRFKDFLRSKE